MCSSEGKRRQQPMRLSLGPLTSDLEVKVKAPSDPIQTVPHGASWSSRGETVSATLISTHSLGGFVSPEVN